MKPRLDPQNLSRAFMAAWCVGSMVGTTASLYANNTHAVMADPLQCTTSKPINGSGLLVSATPGLTIYVCGAFFGMNAVCGTTQLAWFASGTACVTSAQQISPRLEGTSGTTAGQVIAMGGSAGPIAQSSTQDLCVFTSSGIAAVGSVWYVQK